MVGPMILSRKVSFSGLLRTEVRVGSKLMDNINYSKYTRNFYLAKKSLTSAQKWCCLFWWFVSHWKSESCSSFCVWLFLSGMEMVIQQNPTTQPKNNCPPSPYDPYVKSPTIVTETMSSLHNRKDPEDKCKPALGLSQRHRVSLHVISYVLK